MPYTVSVTVPFHANLTRLMQNVHWRCILSFTHYWVHVLVTKGRKVIDWSDTYLCVLINPSVFGILVRYSYFVILF